ncbi:MAG: transglycosylase domain-containing protein [Desulfomonilaceae bacterium]|nr:transglycosylase domain-containing protein [Desulfomonilaceae bacterium]
MAFNPGKIVTAAKKALMAILVISAGYLLVLTGVVLWAFEVRFTQWPTFIYGAPYTVQVGDDIVRTRLFDRLTRLGYHRSPTMVAGPGRWCQSGSGLDVHLTYFPGAGWGVASGPVTFSLDLDRIRSIRLVRSDQDVDKVVLEPELVSVIPAQGTVQRLCRPVPLDRIPKLLIDAIVLTEDRRFHAHHGIDVGSMLRAVKANFKAGRYVQGGSTITQQLIKMTLLSPEKTLFRKINEVFLAVIADALYSKRTILEAYLNRVYLGHWGQFPVNGVAEASRRFFAKDLRKLGPEECAFLAATIMAPNVITPRRHPERALGRRNMVLGLLLKEGKIDRDEYERAKAAPLRIRKPGPPPVRAAAFVDLVKRTMEGERGRGKGNGIEVITSLDPLIQDDANLEIRRMGEQKSDTHLVVMDLRAGDMRAYAAPGPENWDGKGGNLESVLPMATLAALFPEDGERAKFTLTSRLFPRVPGGHPITLREAFFVERSLLTRHLADTVGHEKIVKVLGEFGVRTQRGSGGSIDVVPVSPLEMARSYATLATLGLELTCGVGIKPLPDGTADSLSDHKRVSLPPSSLFLVNYLLKELPPLEEMTYDLEEVGRRPSLFVCRDDHGTWGVAYRTDTLLLVRVPGEGPDPDRLRKMMLRVLPQPGGPQRKPLRVPSGVVFRKICVDSGFRATSICPHVILEPFLKGSQPSEWCPFPHRTKPVRSDGQMKVGKP